MEAVINVFESFRASHPEKEIRELLEQLQARASQQLNTPATPPPTYSPNTPHRARSPECRDTSVSEETLCSQQVDISDLYKLEMATTMSRGFAKIHVGSSYTDNRGCKVNIGTLNQQLFRLKPNTDIVQQHETKGGPKYLSNTQPPFIMPSFKDTQSDYQGANLEDLMEKQLKSLLKLDTPEEYLVIATHKPEKRKQLGLSGLPLQPGSRLLRSRQLYAGIQGPYTYISRNRAVFALHVEDFHLKSANLVQAGAPKLWVIVDPRHAQQLEGRLARDLRFTPRCSQFLRHDNLLLPPSLLHKLEISFSVVLQPSGHLLLLDSGAYHYGVNLGPNIADAINYSEPTWTPPPLYRECSKARGCGGQKHLTKGGMMMGDGQGHDIVDPDVEEVWQAEPQKKISPTGVSSHERTMTLRSREQKGPRISYAKAAAKKGAAKRKGAAYKRAVDSETYDSDDTTNTAAAKKGAANNDSGDTKETPANNKAAVNDKAADEIDEKSAGDDKTADEMDEEAAGDKAADEINKKVAGDDETADEEAADDNETEGVDREPPAYDRGGDKIDMEAVSHDNAEQIDKGTLAKADDKIDIEAVSHNNTVIEIEETPAETNGAPAEKEDVRELWRSYEVEPTYEEGKQVEAIRWWIRFVKDCQQHFSSFRFLCRAEDFEVFDPSREPSAKTWLNDAIIFHLLQLIFKSDHSVQLLDSLKLTAAFDKGDLTKLELEADKRLVAPCHLRNHWSLIVIDLKKKELDVYDTAQQLNFPVVNFLETSFQLTVTWKPLFPKDDDSDNCGVFTVARAEALRSGKLASDNPIELRLRYIQILAKPLRDELASKACLNVCGRLAKRKSSSSDDDVLQPSVKKPKHIPFTLTSALVGSSALDSTKLWGEWATFHQSGIGWIDPAESDLITALVAAVACPQVMADLADLLKDTGELSLSENFTESALRLYKAGEIGGVRSGLQKRYAAVHVYLRFEEILSLIRRDKMNLKKRKRQNYRSGIPNKASGTTQAKSIALNRLTAEAWGISEEQARLDANRHLRDEVRRLNLHGEAACLFDRAGSYRLWNLMPARQMASALDGNYIISPDKYIKLSKEGVERFHEGLRKLRPNLDHLIRQAEFLDQHLLNPRKGSGVVYKLEKLEPEEILSQPLDSDILLRCLDPVASE